MTTEVLWIAIAVIAVLIIAALIFGLIRYRRDRISLAPPPVAGEPKMIDRSGGYTASSGITFSQSAPAETVPAPARETPPDVTAFQGLPTVGDDATIPRDAPKRPIEDLRLPEPELVTPLPEPITETAPAMDTIAPTAGRLERLRGRLSKSQNALGRSVLGLLGGGDLDEESWEEVEDTLEGYAELAQNPVVVH